MGEIRQTLISITFSLFCIGLIVFSFSAKLERQDFSKKNSQDPVAGESYFKEINYFITGEKPVLQLEASELSLNDFTKNTIFFEAEGVVFGKNQQPVYYEGDKGVLAQKTGLLTMEGEVKLRFNDSRSNADKMRYYLNENRIISEGNVHSESYSRSTGDKLKVDSQRAENWLDKERSFYSGGVKGKIERKRAYEEGMDFKSKTMELDMKMNYAELKDDVFIKKQQLRANSRRGEIFLENYNKKLKYFVLYDDVKVRETVRINRTGTWEPFERRAFSEKLEGITSESKVVLTGYPKVYQQQDVIKGNRIILRENNEVVEVDDANTNFILKE